MRLKNISFFGDLVIIDCMPDDVPNTFTVLDQNGNVVAANMSV